MEENLRGNRIDFKLFITIFKKLRNESFMHATYPIVSNRNSNLHNQHPVSVKSFPFSFFFRSEESSTAYNFKERRGGEEKSNLHRASIPSRIVNKL